VAEGDRDSWVVKSWATLEELSPVDAAPNTLLWGSGFTFWEDES
jgi:hypothetical protein